MVIPIGGDIPKTELLLQLKDALVNTKGKGVQSYYTISAVADFAQNIPLIEC